MATKKTPKTSDLSMELPGNEAELDQAIDDLRGVLKTDADGGLPDFAGESEAFSGSTDLSTFGGDFEDTAGDSAFGGSDFGATSDFGGSPDFGDSSFNAIASEPAPLGSAMQSNLDLQWVTAHYRGNAPAINDLLGGQVQFAFDQLTVSLQHIKAGLFRALAVTSPHRLKSLPDVPTFAELGYKDFDGQTFTGLFAPADTPAPIVDKLHETLVAILKDPGVIDKFEKLGGESTPMTPDEFKAYLAREDAKWIPVVRKANIKAD